jgi:hypothetical protein
MAQHLKDQLTQAFNGQGAQIIKVAEMRVHFDRLTDQNLGFLQRNLVKSANPCGDFALAKLARVLIPRADGTLGLYAQGQGRVAEHNAYFHSETLLLVFHAAVDQVKVPPGFRDLQAKVVDLSIQAYLASACHLPKLQAGALRPVKHAELLGK